MNMKNQILLGLIGLFMMTGLMAQTVAEAPQTMVENMYILPKRGMEDKLEAAVKAHNTKFHPEGPYVAGLRKIEYGEKAGWYVFIYGPTTYDNLDNRPEKANGHDADWSTTVDPLIETYGTTSLWNLDKDLSFGYDILKKSKYYEIWSVKLKEGEYYRFKALSEKLKKAYESLGTTAFVVFESPLHNSNGQDIGLLWSFNTYKEWADDPGPKAAFEKIYGAGSWQNMMKEWRDVCVDYSDEIRSFVR